ncbi:hypothetical protein CSPB12327_07045 [Campylobacter sp. RM12327]|uniref:Cell division protein n=1 Tax=Campylobacter sputorum subsp. sputorum TaxID=32024 RepID=A0A381DHX5_9BACT|nr:MULTISPECIES: hypothetical protein [Campylobacter]ASM35175.1 hypothetical protein CSPUT_0961 [Campylobacter sputorum aubsp. sputorum RM3237]ASM38546.1 hypothetical protein CSPARA_0981 [Campylobacter sputorum bv. paraureolyticus LMG 11764]ASM40154.1 hypothetical protein CSPB_0937 [Campylobacter sputorum]KAB0581019.1 hypothetical protein F7P64_07835 [Campylobacter sputorum subsp. sputorum]MBE7358550.1 hypothetical protein [Campylobacter sp. RM11302]
MKNQDTEISQDELMYEISVLLEGLLYYAGVKKDNLQEAVKIYVENIDDILKDSKAEGVDEIIEVIEYIKKENPKLFL